MRKTRDELCVLDTTFRILERKESRAVESFEMSVPIRDDTWHLGGGSTNVPIWKYCTSIPWTIGIWPFIWMNEGKVCKALFHDILQSDGSQDLILVGMETQEEGLREPTVVAFYSSEVKRIFQKRLSEWWLVENSLWLPRPQGHNIMTIVFKKDRNAIQYHGLLFTLANRDTDYE